MCANLGYLLPRGLGVDRKQKSESEKEMTDTECTFIGGLLDGQTRFVNPGSPFYTFNSLGRESGFIEHKYERIDEVTFKIKRKVKL